MGNSAFGRRAFRLIACVGMAVSLLAAGEADAKSRKKRPAPIPAYATSVAWGAVGGPSLGAAKSIGSYAAGCITGARALPPEGVGYQVIRLSRQRNYGHPVLTEMLRDFGQRVAQAGLGTALIGDMGQARGGPMPSGHASHQIGLDADVWLRLDLPPMGRAGREGLDEIKYVDYDLMRVTAGWSERQAKLIQIAASDARVARIFVNPAIKLAMCQRNWPDRGFLNKLRPWHGHDGHMHIRLNCPAGSPLCEQQDAQPEGDGCGDELMSWLDSASPAIEHPPGHKPEPRVVRKMPAACAPVLNAAGTRMASLPELGATPAKATR
ncbi:penicillin-insensitive murein endopeptidase [Azospirillum sp. YIM B02556]|uniref:Penicillin-insensitive murein endopeptidase n=1 Tax=Azospirillum endophyticum TaxID=2800326 RepID=A0ABS1F9G7_9PROT|nr:penicillin-insensitive murein endopeptidase [Azospirillum endophyticum]MBK1839897.1 penicillin-insensitive murein endopeptidase [Azospirillum endophyticum]